VGQTRPTTFRVIWARESHDEVLKTARDLRMSEAQALMVMKQRKKRKRSEDDSDSEWEG
jgi:hypothetical protein